MATQGVAGRRGFISFAATSSGSATELTGVTEYAITVEQAQAEAFSNDSSGWNEHLPVTRQWTLAYSIVATSQNYTDLSDPARWVRTLGANASVSRWMTLYPTTGSPSNRWQGTVVPESVEITGDMGDIARADFVCQGHKALLYTS